VLILSGEPSLTGASAAKIEETKNNNSINRKPIVGIVILLSTFNIFIGRSREYKNPDYERTG
tara:strand:- start:317 stop:502 length:186 start_codon:yes stop_codon:yes gene_type:complete